MGGGGWGWRATDAPNRLFMKGVGLSLSRLFSPTSDLLCLRSFRSKYNASIANYLLGFCLLFVVVVLSCLFVCFWGSTLRPKKKKKKSDAEKKLLFDVTLNLENRFIP